MPTSLAKDNHLCNRKVSLLLKFPEANFKRMARKRAEVVEEYVRQELRAMAAAGPHGTASQLAKRLGIAPAHFSNITAPKPTRNPGEGVRRAFAEMHGITLDELEARATGGKPTRGAAKDKFPARSDALQRLQGVILPDVAKAIQGREFKGAEALTVADWIADALEEDKRFRRGILPGFAATEADDRP
jgi:hypothetical protein